MITYNHENYISKAVESVLMQQTNFDFELVIANDCSTDNTSSVMQSIKDERLKYIKQKVNLGANGNFNFCLNEAKGKIIKVIGEGCGLGFKPKGIKRLSFDGGNELIFDDIYSNMTKEEPF